MANSAPRKISLPIRDQFDAHDEGHSSASDSEYQHALEVVFDAQNAHRRKSSLVTADTPAATFQRRKNTECYVHALLESQRKSGRASNSGLEGIAETLASRRIASATDGADEKEDKLVDPKAHNHDEEEETCGQVDETCWRDNIKAKDAMQAIDDGESGKVQLQTGEVNATHSRLLTKKQLSDMAWGVRELSKRLGSIRLKLKVKTVFILTKAHDESLIANTREVTRWLLSPERLVRYTVWVEENLRDSKKFDAQGLLDELEKSEEGQVNGDKHKRLRYWSSNMCRTRPHTFDFIVTLGGDGTVLYASWLFQRIVPPVLSFALGSLGFLTKFDFGDFEKQLTTAFRDGVTISLRLRFEGTVMRSQTGKIKAVENGEKGDESSPMRDLVEELVGEEKEDERTHRPDGTYEILNDIVVDRGPNPSK
ncbi:hypothetical protein NHQ30_001716 [Ciborinia camelliae]|nr:hypothetical protein NHQ30_001716 [Ciborinia camelliae]